MRTRRRADGSARSGVRDSIDLGGRAADHGARGFTLIELMVTIAIVAILVGAVVLNLEFRNPGTVVRDVARRTALVMELAADQAVYARQQFGIRFHPDSYEFWILAPAEDEEGEEGGAPGEAAASEEPVWQIFADERLRYAAPDIPIEFQVDISGVPVVLAPLEEELDDATDEDPLKPHVLFLSNGEITPDFRIVVADPDGRHRYELRTGEVEPLVLEQLAGDAS